MQKEITLEYIRGLVEGEGCFTFHSVPGRVGSGFDKMIIPVFVISMHERDENLLKAVRDKLGLKNKIYNHKPSLSDGYNRSRKAVLFVRDIGALKNIIIPLFYNKLIGNKGIQFIEWLDRIGTDPAVPDIYKLLYRLHKSGFYEKSRKLID